MSYTLYKALGLFSEPLSAFALLLFFSVLLTYSKWEKAKSFGHKTIAVLSIILFLMLVFPVGQWAVLPLEGKYEPSYPKQVDGIVVLTGDESVPVADAHDIPVMNHAANRYLALARLAKLYPKAKIAVVGNPTPHFKSKKTSVQSMIQDVLDGIGISRARVSFETKSRTTYENAEFAKKKVNPKKGQTWLLLTSAFHMPRAVLCFEAEGWKVTPFPTDYFTIKEAYGPHIGFSLQHQIRLLTRAYHEYMGLLIYRLSGWTQKLW